jgi:ribosomal protein S12 methylthiotransferase accessory factor YcaO
MRVIPVAGVTALPDIAELVQETENRPSQWELALLSVASGLAVICVSCAWVLLALE